MSRWISRILILALAVSTAAAGAQDPAPAATATLEAVGTRGWFTVRGPIATFDPAHPSVDIWAPGGEAKAPVIVYAHGGAGFRADDRARIEMMRRNGFATISFDAYDMNGLEDWEFVSRRVINSGKQNLIWNVFRGAVDHALQGDAWDNRNVFFYGGSNGGRVILHAGAAISDERIRGIISEAPAATGFELGDYDVPTIVSFGGLDTWAGKSPTDFVWLRTYPSSPVSIKNWVDERQQAGRPVEFVLYENAGHLLFDGPLEEVTVKRGDKIAFTAFKGAAEGVLELYERDVREFVLRHVE